MRSFSSRRIAPWAVAVVGFDGESNFTLRKGVPLFIYANSHASIAPRLSRNDSDKWHWQTDIYPATTKLETWKDVQPPESLEENTAVKLQLSEEACKINHAWGWHMHPLQLPDVP